MPKGLVVGRTGQTGVGGPVGIQVYGVRELISKLFRINVITNLEVGFTTRAAAEFIQKRAQELVPVETGNLQSGIKVQKYGPFSWAVTASSQDGDNPDKNGKEYAGFVEFGTSVMSAKPFLRPAANEARPLVGAAMVALSRRIMSL